MTPARFQEILDAYGGDPRRWPAVERADAEALFAHSAEARRARDEAFRLDRLLVCVPAPVAPPLDPVLLAARVMANAQPTPPVVVLGALLDAAGLRRRAVAGFALAATLAGFVVGFGLSSDSVNGDEFLGLLPAPVMEVDPSW